MATSGSWEISWESSYWDQPFNPKYYHWSGNWTKSGNTITLSGMKLWMSFTYASGGYGVTDVVSTTGGSSYTISYPNFSNTYQTDKVSLNNSSFTVGSTATSATISCIISGENTGSTTINFDATYVAPTTPTISATVSGTTATITYGTTSFGTPSSGTVTLYGGTTSSPTTSIDTTNTTGNKTFSHTGLTPGTTYYYRARANNGQLNSNYSTEVTITVPVSATQVLYGSVNGQTKQVQKLYGSVRKVASLPAKTASTLISAYDSNTFLNLLSTNFPEWLWKRPTYIRVRSQSNVSYLEIAVGTSFISYTTLISNVTTQQLQTWGITLGTTLPLPSGSSAVITLDTTYTLATKNILKLYGSVNGQTKLIYQA